MMIGCQGPTGLRLFGWTRAGVMVSAALLIVACGSNDDDDDVAVVEPPPAVAYFEDFSESRLSASRWLDLEAVRLPASSAPGSLLLEQSATGRLGATQSVTLGIRDAASVTSMEVPITVEEAFAEDSNNGNAQVTARIIMALFNDGRPGTGNTGDVLAQVRLNRAAGGELTRTATVLICKNSDCTDGELLGSATDMPPVAVGQTHVLRIRWEGTQVTVGLDGFSQQIALQGVTQAGPARTPFAQAQTRIERMETADEKGYIRARLGAVKVNGNTYDDFSSGNLDPSRWLHYGFERRVVDGKFHSRATAHDGFALSNSLRLADPVGVSRMGADIAVVSAEEGGMEPRARVGGTWYSSSSEGTGSAGDVFAEVGLVRKGTALVGRATIARCLDANCGQTEAVLLEEDALGTFEMGRSYPTSIAWNGSKFRFVVGDKSFEYTPGGTAAPIGGARSRFMLIGTRVVGGATSDVGSMLATFDNVVVDRQP